MITTQIYDAKLTEKITTSLRDLAEDYFGEEGEEKVEAFETAVFDAWVEFFEERRIHITASGVIYADTDNDTTFEFDDEINDEMERIFEEVLKEFN